MKVNYHLSHFLVLLSLSVYADANDEKCCPRKKVGGVRYTFSHQDSAAKEEYDCANECIYTEDDDGSQTCFKPGQLKTECIGPKCKKLPDLPKKYCQPGQKCWPTKDDLNNFSGSINGDSPSCLSGGDHNNNPIPKFLDRNNPKAHKMHCLSYNGLLKNIANTGDLERCKPEKSQSNYLDPDPNCDANPFITGAHYKNTSTGQKACMTPYQFLTNRNYHKEWMPAFIVTTNSSSDISKALIFAQNHSLGVAVMATGHDMQDRNMGPGPNSLLIRTTCFREFKAFPDKDIQGYNEEVWKEGYAVVGAGQTFGTNYWYELEKSEGLYRLAGNHNREIVGGTCHSVGIVGWMLGAGKGWTTPMYGLGVDNLLHVDIITANGTPTFANYTYNKDLFWAIRGGGGGFGVITSLKIKLHKPVCGTMENCYSVWNASWQGHWTPRYQDPHRNQEIINDIKTVFNVIFNWTSQYKLYWNSLINLSYNHTVQIFSLSIISYHFGTKEMNVTNFNSFREAFRNLTIRNSTHEFNGKPYDQDQPPIITDKYYCEIFPHPNNPNNCTTYPWVVQRWSQYIRMLVNSSVTLEKPKNGSKGFLDTFLDHWQPMCDNYPYSPCSTGFQLHYFFQNGNKTYNTGGAISTGFRNAAFQFLNNGVHRNRKVDLTFQEKQFWMHYTLGPAMYEFSNASYFNEAEYTLDPGQWEERFWGKEKHCRLLGIKKKYDPEYRLNCRHCVGSEVGSEPNK